jgi:serine protease Do
MSKRTVQAPVWFAAIIVAAALAVGGLAGQLTRGGPVFTVAAAGPETDTRPGAGIRSSFAPIVKLAAPSVVNIWSSRVVKNNQENNPFLQDPFFRQFFGNQFGHQQVPKERRERSLGSGVVLSSDGYILTNYHVVENGSDIKVSMSDRREFSARLVGRDSKTDLAVVKIDQTNLQPIRLGDSSKVQVGDIALAIGNPFGIGRTVTMGVVSAVGRGGLGIEQYEDFIQTDASINPGNSGGALIDANGDLIGINTAILSEGAGNQGIGFAIPVNMARNVMEQIVKTGKVAHAYLGVSIQEVTPDIATAFKLNGLAGALIGDVEKGSPAEKAGLRAGDVVTEVDGKPLPDARSLQLAIAQMQPGQTVHLTVMRDGHQQNLTATLGDQPPDATQAGSEDHDGSAAEPSAAEQILDGVQATALTPQIARQLKMPADTKGVVLTDVAQGSAAAEAGLDQGDVILEVNRKPVSTVDQFKQVIQQAGKQPILLFINRQGRTTYVVVPAHE